MRRRARWETRLFEAAVWRQMDEGKVMSLTRYVAEFTLGLSYDDIPENVRTSAIEHILDGYGVGLAGNDEKSHAILRGYSERAGCAGEATIWGTPLKSTAELAALINGLAMHAMDYDDTQLSTNPESVYGLLTHPTTPALGASSAVAEVVGASGTDLLTAYVAGVEVACRTSDASNPRHYQKGFHSTGTFGAIGAAAAAAKILGLDLDQTLHALGIAASLSGGYRESFGTMTKPLHAGLAAQAGVFAARLASESFTAATNILEAKFSFPFFLAIAILRRKVGIAEFRDEVVRSTEVQDMMKRCRHVIDHEIDARGFQHLDTRVTIRVKDGREFERVESFATGHPKKPISRDHLEHKFFECAALAIDENKARQAANLIWRIDELEHVG